MTPTPREVPVREAEIERIAMIRHKNDHPAVEDCRVGLNMEPRPEWAGQRKCVLDAERDYDAGLRATPRPR